MMRRSSSLLHRGRIAAQCNINHTLAANTAVACAPSTLSIRFTAPSVSRPFTSSSRFLAAEAAAQPSTSSDAASDTIYLQTNWNRIPEWAEAAKPQLVSLGDLQPRPGTMKRAKRYGRGPGSGLGKTCGKGHKGQGQRKGLRKRGFEGGSTPFWRRMPKIGVTNATRYWKMLRPLTIRKVQEYVQAGRIDGTQLITMKTLVDSGCVSKVEHGVKLLSGGLTRLKRPLHFQLTDCSEQARGLLESNGGSVHLVWFNKTTLRAHLHPLKFLQKHGRLPKATGVPPPKKAAKYGFVIEHVDY